MAGTPLTKRALIDKTNTTVVIIVSIAAFVSVFSLVATKTLVSQITYQNRVITEKRKAVGQLKKNVDNVKDLKISYDAFTGSVTNVMKGNSQGIGPKDGDNARIVLDALPSVYDFPSTVTSMQVVATSNGLAAGITGTDNEIKEATNKLSSAPAAVEIPFTLSAKGSYDQVKNLVDALQRTIRPVDVKMIDISAGDDELTVSIDGSTYYQPGKSLTYKTKVVK